MKSSTIVCTLVVVMLAAWMAAYFSLVQPVLCGSSMKGFTGFTSVEYRIGGAYAKALFAPVHWIDRNVIRPGYWKWNLKGTAPSNEPPQSPAAPDRLW